MISGRVWLSKKGGVQFDRRCQSTSERVPALVQDFKSMDTYFPLLTPAFSPRRETGEYQRYSSLFPLPQGERGRGGTFFSGDMLPNI